MSKHRRASTSVVVVAYINIVEAVKVSVQMNLTADMEDQQWWRGKLSDRPSDDQHHDHDPASLFNGKQ